jgi:3'(2'),5'-bisphosphate nucleotidase
MQFNEELVVAINVAQDAGKLLLDLHPNPSGIETKLDGSIVTDSDRKSSELITRELRKHFPKYGILDEESVDERSGREYCWIVDPLDDTRGYVEKTGSFGIIIALTKNSEPVLGVTYRPYIDELLYARRGLGAFRVKEEGIEKISVSKSMDIHLLISSSRSSPELEKMIEEIKPSRVTKMGGSLKTVEVAKGNGTVFLCPKSSTMHLWDLCGPSVILEEAGGKITDAYGHAIDYSQKDTVNANGIVATNSILHQSIIDISKN